MQTTKQPQLGSQSQSERLFFNSLSSDYTSRIYRLYLDKFLQAYGYDDLDHLARSGQANPKIVENQIIDLIITSKEKGMKRAAINNYTKPVMTFCKVMDITLNAGKINRYTPRRIKGAKTFAYSHEQIHKLLELADERMTAVILLLSSSGLRIGGLSSLKTGSLSEVGDLYQITVYPGEPEEYITFCSSEARRALETYFDVRRRHGEVINNKTSPVIREQYDRKDFFATPLPRHVREPALARKLVDLAEAAGIRSRVKLAEGQKAASVRQDVPCCNGMRRFFTSILLKSGVQSELRFLLEGHNLKFNDESYVHVSMDDLLAQYMKAHDNLLISQEHKLRERVETLELERNQFEQLRARIESMEAKYANAN